MFALGQLQRDVIQYSIIKCNFESPPKAESIAIGAEK